MEKRIKARVPLILAVLMFIPFLSHASVPGNDEPVQAGQESLNKSIDTNRKGKIIVSARPGAKISIEQLQP